MASRDYILKKLQETDDYLSGEEMAEELDITRAAVWQSIHDLREMGYHIEAVTNRGYRLNRDYEALDEGTIRKGLVPELEGITVLVEDQVDSTNDAIFRYDNKSALPSFSLMVAEEQTAGKGRVGKSFLSPYGSGLYLSMILKRGAVPFDPATLTIAAAVATREALAEQTEAKIEIKWVNDLYLDHKKICGILTEADLTCGAERYVVGIGVNVVTSEDTFEKRGLDTAGSLGDGRISRNRLAAGIVNAFFRATALEKGELMDRYRDNNLTLNKRIRFARGDIEYTGIVQDIDEDGRLVVDVNGERVRLDAGSISIQGNW